MPFGLSADQEMIRNVVREFASQEVGPRAAAIDRERAFPRDVLAKAAGLGLLGMLVPAEKGGAGTDTASYAVALEELAKASGTVAAALAAQNAWVTYPLASRGTGRDDLLPALLSGARLGAFALAEPGAGSDLGMVRTRARAADGGLVLDGLKSFVLGGSEADVYLVVAKEGDGTSAFLVDREAEGVAVGPAERTLALRGGDFVQVFLKGVKIPESSRVGAKGEGITLATEALAMGRLSAAAMAVGIMQASLDESRSYAGQRQQFRQPIKNFQAIQWKIAEMDTETRAARLLTYAAASKRDAGEGFEEDLAAAHLFAGEAAKRVTQQALRIHGGTGFMRDVPLERFNRDARAMSIFSATSEMERATLAARLLELQ